MMVLTCCSRWCCSCCSSCLPPFSLCTVLVFFLHFPLSTWAPCCQVLYCGEDIFAVCSPVWRGRARVGWGESSKNAEDSGESIKPWFATSSNWQQISAFPVGSASTRDILACSTCIEQSLRKSARQGPARACVQETTQASSRALLAGRASTGGRQNTLPGAVIREKTGEIYEGAGQGLQVLSALYASKTLAVAVSVLCLSDICIACKY